MKIKINSIFGKLIFEADCGSIKEAVLTALKNNVNLSDSNLSGANLSDSNLRGANLSDSNLSGANLSDSNLSDSNLRDSNLRGANLIGANLSGANLSGANLRGANLSGANLRGANLSGANLRGANLSGANLSDSNLSGANLSGANLRGKKVKSVRVFSGIYRYQIFSILTMSGERYVKMGCLFYSLAEWEKIGILNSNLNEFPNDGSRKSKEREEAFEFSKNAALKLE